MNQAEAIKAAMNFYDAFKGVYAERMTAAAIMGGNAPLEQMTEAKKVIMDRMDATALQAANMVRAFHIGFCDDIGHEVPTEYRAALIEAFEAQSIGC